MLSGSRYLSQIRIHFFKKLESGIFISPKQELFEKSYFFNFGHKVFFEGRIRFFSQGFGL